MLEGNDTADTRWTQLNELYHAAMARQRRERGVFLRQACPDDDQLRREVESLLRYAGRELESVPGGVS